MSKVDNQTATMEITRWLDFKKVGEKKREDNQQFIDSLIEAVENGSVTIDEKNNLVYTLPDPVLSDDDEPVLETLTFKPRITVKELNSKLKGVKTDDADGRILAYVSAITGENAGTISRMYSEHYAVCTSIVMFFL